jgi:hypothetical protein
LGTGRTEDHGFALPEGGFLFFFFAKKNFAGPGERTALRRWLLRDCGHTVTGGILKFAISTRSSDAAKKLGQRKVGNLRTKIFFPSTPNGSLFLFHLGSELATDHVIGGEFTTMVAFLRSSLSKAKGGIEDRKHDRGKDRYK